MRRIQSVWLLVLTLLLFSLSPFTPIPIRAEIPAPSIDGSCIGSGGGGTCTLTTTKQPDVIIIFAGGSTNCGSGITATDTKGLSYTTRAASLGPASGGIMELYAIATTTLSSDVITLSSCEPLGFGVSGAYISKPFDTAAGLPETDNTNAGSAFQLLTPVNNANDFLIFATSQSGTFTAGSCCTLIQQEAGRMGAEYEKGNTVSPSGYLLTASGGNTNGMISDALTAYQGSVTCLTNCVPAPNTATVASSACMDPLTLGCYAGFPNSYTMLIIAGIATLSVGLGFKRKRKAKR